MSENGVTRLLERWQAGEESAFQELVPLVYDQLHRMSKRLMRAESPDHTLQATALLNEVYLKLIEERRAQWESRAHFFAFAARLMRNILIDHARSRLAQRRGGGRRSHIPLSPDLAWIGSTDENILDLHRALKRLGEAAPRQARVIELRYFLALTNEEAAEALGLSLASVERDLRFARGWLFRELHPSGGGA